ncbi:MAG: class I SAM-dependent methyltransferase, partial [Sciscionella sp.]
MATHTHDGIDWAARLEYMRRAVALEAAALSGVAGRLVGELPAGTATVVDFGCGAGGMSAAFAAAMRSCGGTLVLVDAVAELLEAATSEARSVAGQGVEVRPVLADAAAEGLAELVPPADLVWASHVLHHLPDELHAAGRLAGLLRQGGRLALGEGGLPTRCLPWNLGLGEPGLEHRLEVAGNEWFTAMRENIPGTVRLPVGWNLVLAEIGLADLETFSYLV